MRILYYSPYSAGDDGPGVHTRSSLKALREEGVDVCRPVGTARSRSTVVAKLWHRAVRRGLRESTYALRVPPIRGSLSRSVSDGHAWMLMTAVSCLVFALVEAQFPAMLYSNYHVWLSAGVALATCSAPKASACHGVPGAVRGLEEGVE